MARLPRLAIDGQLHRLRHDAVIGRSIFAIEADRSEYLAALLDVSRQSEVAIHAYVLIPQCVDLLMTPRRGAEVASMMQRLGRRFAEVHNRRHGMTGSSWAGRYRTSVLQPSLYLLEAMRYLESRPVTLGLAGRAEEWTSSSASHHAGLRFDPLVSDHPIFWALGNTPFERELAYRRLCQCAPANAIAFLIDEATTKGWALGDAEFIEQLSIQQARRLLPSRRGRPKLVSVPN